MSILPIHEKCHFMIRSSNPDNRTPSSQPRLNFALCENWIEYVHGHMPFYYKAFITMLLLTIVKMVKEMLFSQEKLQKCFKTDLGPGPTILNQITCSLRAAGLDSN